MMPPPSLYLKVWIRHCTYLTSKPSRPKQPRRRFRMNKSKIKYSGVDGFTFDQSTGWFLQLVHFSFRFVLLTCSIKTQCLLCFSNLVPQLFPRISDLFSSRKPGWNFSYEPKARLRVVPHFSSGIFIERTKRERAWKSPHARKGDDFYARSRFVRSWLSLRKNEGLLVVKTKAKFIPIYTGPGARFLKVPIINGPGKLSPFTLMIEVSIVLHLTW